jgi:hypothetical protein
MVDMIYLKKHKTENGFIIAMCDSELIDKVLYDGVVEINIKDYSAFYKGELLSGSKAKEQLDSKDIYSANVIGEESVNAAIESSIIERGNVKTVKKVPYAQAFKIK